MSSTDFASLSNQAITVAGIIYFIALLAHLVEWSRLRAVVPAEAPVGAATGGTTGAAEGDVLVRTGGPGADEPADPADSEAKVAFWARLGVVLTVFAAVVHLVGVVTRGLGADPVRVPWGNMYEFTITATLVAVVIYLALHKRFQLAWLGPVMVGFTWVVLLAAVRILYVPVAPLMPSLQSPWLIIHVFAAILATGAFTVAGMASIIYLIKESRARKGKVRPRGYLDRIPSLPALDRVAYRVTAFAFPVWTFGVLIAGPIWAENAWGRYWGWDPKEVWSFITWVVFAAYLHARATRGWKGRHAAILCLVGLVTLWFNFVGINYFFGDASQHSYALEVLIAIR
ncbi:c-type cytochrome biogenesis protein CcsB [Nocardioides massiliensis]|uniref:Cytochrome c-type biogenesis protein CcsB n=1 Tax=Nocardioides massiliensis TaxID=1325935 RepID=A0ABT9NMN8_9ACTN|nr:c-type cytochrome biogenesis protein CcsB [Nocardioides massiliensis]MDP9821689.1 cytochrome c-type biogenesis protein CcsB [Nocardioides massiliensis]